MSDEPSGQSEPVEELTICRPLTFPNNRVTLTFKHRRCITIPNFDTPVTVARCPVGPDLGGNPERSWSIKNVRYPTYVLPTRAFCWWVDPGEIGLLSGCTAMRFVSADLNIHNSSFRTQFVTGSNAVNFANSNMIMHGMIVDHQHNFPLHQLYLKGREPATGANMPDNLSPTDINNTEWGSYTPPWTIPDGPANPTQTGMTVQFGQAAYVPWFFHAYTDTTGQPVNNCKSHWLKWAALCEIVGKKVKNWKKHYDLAATWQGRWLANRGHFPADNYNGLTDAQTDRGGWKYTPDSQAGTLRNNIGNAAAGFRELAICPTRSMELFEATQGWYNPTTGKQAASRTAGVNEFPNKDLRPIPNLFLGVEHLQNVDGSIVPIIWDFYLDTEITVELEFSKGCYIGTDISAYNIDGAPIATIDDYSLCTHNARDDFIFADNNINSIIANTTAYEGGPPKWGQPKPMVKGFGTTGPFGAMQSTQTIDNPFPDLAVSLSFDSLGRATAPKPPRK